MPLDEHACFRALRARDRRFDGRFFAGVATTGIYCRPICPARTAKRENLRFFPSAAAAERAGLRPCLRCRPERAPGVAPIDAAARLVAAAVAGIERHALSGARVDELAASLGVTDRHLRRVMNAELGVSPIELAQTQRLLLAKRLLDETALPQTEIALASGFASLRRFNAAFKARYGASPRALRGRVRRDGALRCRLERLALIGGQAVQRLPHLGLRQFQIGHAAGTQPVEAVAVVDDGRITAHLDISQNADDRAFDPLVLSRLESEQRIHFCLEIGVDRSKALDRDSHAISPPPVRRRR